MYREVTEILVGKNENLIFHEHFFNMDISCQIQREESMSQNVDLGHTGGFYLIKCRGLHFQKWQRVNQFLT